MSLLLNTDPYMHVERYGFMFHLRTDDDGRMFDQWNVEWKNIAENGDSFIPEPLNPKYMDTFMDLYNDLKSYSI